MDIFVVNFTYTDVIDLPEVHPEDPDLASTSIIYILGVDGHDFDCDCDHPTESDPELTPTQVKESFVIGLFDTLTEAQSYAYSLKENSEFLKMCKDMHGKIVITKSEYNLRMTPEEIFEKIDWEQEEILDNEMV